MTKKILFWVLIALVVLGIGIGLYLKYAGFGDTLMALLIGVLGMAAGWVLKWFYDKYVKGK